MTPVSSRPCMWCEGEGQVARNFGIDAPGRPEIVPCRDCDGTGVSEQPDLMQALKDSLKEATS